MTVKQLSVFLENKVGRINDVARILGEHGINMTAFSLADSGDFGILRMVVSDAEGAEKILRENQCSVRLTDVIYLRCSNTPGAMSNILELLAAKEVFIEYMYAFAQGESANIVIRPNNMQTCLEVLKAHKQLVVTAADL